MILLLLVIAVVLLLTYLFFGEAPFEVSIGLFVSLWWLFLLVGGTILIWKGLFQ
jgi:hypothetical protein